MEKTVRIALIGFLIVMAYATSIYLDAGSWIVPFPIFSYIILVVIIVSTWSHKENYRAFIPLLTVMSLRCLSNPFTYTFFLDESSYLEFTDGITLSIFRILETFSVFPLVILTVGFKGNHLPRPLFAVYPYPNPAIRFIQLCVFYWVSNHYNLSKKGTLKHSCLGPFGNLWSLRRIQCVIELIQVNLNMLG